jgi:hypothetical protein
VRVHSWYEFDLGQSARALLCAIFSAQNAWMTQMPIGSIALISAIIIVFVTFAAVLAWGDRYSQSACK